MAANFGKGLSYLIAGQFQALGLFAFAWFVGDWLNENHPLSFSWYGITFPVAIIAVFQTFFIIVRQLIRGSSGGEAKKPPPSSGSVS